MLGLRVIFVPFIDEVEFFYVKLCYWIDSSFLESSSTSLSSIYLRFDAFILVDPSFMR